MTLSLLGIPKVAKPTRGGSSDQTTFTNRTFVVAVMVHIVNTRNETNLNFTSSTMAELIGIHLPQVRLQPLHLDQMVTLAYKI